MDCMLLPLAELMALGVVEDAIRPAAALASVGRTFVKMAALVC